MKLFQLINAEILIENNKTKYQSGETIIGSVNIALNGELDLSRVSIALRAVSELEWVEVIGGNHKEGYVFRDSEEYLNVVYKIPESLRKTVITAGQHSIPFVFKLQDDIPSSYESNDGFIHYWIETKINVNSHNQEDYCEKKYFTVESPFRNGLHLSVGGGTEKYVGFLSLEREKVRIDASISKKGYSPGDTVEVHCLVTNTSSVAVTPRAAFIELHILMAKENHKTRGASSDPVIGEKVNAGQTREQTISVQIPKDISLSIKTRLISIKYFIHITFDVPHALDIHLNLPIIITNEFALNNRNA